MHVRYSGVALVFVMSSMYNKVQFIHRVVIGKGSRKVLIMK